VSNERVGLIEKLADGELDTRAPVDDVKHGEVGSLSRPIGVAHVLEDRARRRAGYRHQSKGPQDTPTSVIRLQSDSHLTGW
jgi:hypothetical protein